MNLLPRVILIIIIFSACELQAQIDRNQNLDPEFPDTSSFQVDSNYLVPDTTILNYFYIDQINQKHNFVDTGISYPFSQIDFARRGKIDHLNLGNPGSAQYPIFQQINDNKGFDPGLYQYDIYRTENDSFKFYDLNRPYTNVFFSPGSSQQNFLIETTFARKFSNGVSAIIDYYRINQEGLYTNQKTRHTMFSVGLWYQSKSNKFNSFFSYISNALTEENNGGVSDETLFDNPSYSIRLSIPVIHRDAFTRHETREFTFNNILRLNNPKKETAYSLRHEFVFQAGKYKYFDPSTSSSLDSSFYQEYLIDNRGLRFFLTDDKIENSFYFYSKWKKFGDVRIGLSHMIHQIDLDQTNETINNLFANFRSSVNITTDLNLDVEANLGLLDHAGDFQIKGKARLALAIGEFLFSTNFKRNKPPLIANQLFINEQLIYENDFARPLSLDFRASWTFGKTHISFSQLTIDKPIYFNEKVLPVQFDGTYTTSRFQLSQMLKFGILHFDNHLYYQIFSDELYNLPDYFTKHDLYLKSQLFKSKMLFKCGLELRIISEFTGPAYFPLTGQFYQQKDKVFGFYPESDFYFTFKVDTFRAFFRMNNISDYFYSGARYHIDKYPQFDSNFRFGISWIMKD